MTFALVKEGDEAYLDDVYSVGNGYRYKNVANAGGSTGANVNGKTFSWEFKSTGDGLAYSESDAYYICIFGATTSQIKISQVWLD